LTKAEDCDGQATLVASLLLSIGIPARFIVIGPKGNRTHVFTEAYVNGQWLAVDTVDRVHQCCQEYLLPKRIFSINTDGTLDTLKLKGGIASLSQSNDPQWMQIANSVSNFFGQIEQLKAEGKLTDADVNNASSAIMSLFPTGTESKVDPQTIKNVPKYVNLYKSSKNILDVVTGPVGKVVGVIIVGGLTVLLVMRLKRR
jgi:hypothetical protein